MSGKALNSEKRLQILLFAIVFTLSMFFAPFFPWINGTSGIYCEAGYVDVTIDGRGNGLLEYSTYAGEGRVKFSCPIILVFSTIFVVSCFIYLFFIGKIFYGRHKSMKFARNSYSEVAKFMILYGILILALAYVFLTTYMDFPVYGIEGVDTIGDLEDYAISLGCELIGFGTAFGFWLVVLVGLANVFLGILLLLPDWTSS